MENNKLEKYQSFEEKKIFFKHAIIKEITDLANALNYLYNITVTSKPLFYRGEKNASYKLYSSMQICCFKKKNISMTDLSNEIIRRFDNNPILTEAFCKEVNKQDIEKASQDKESYESRRLELTKWALIQYLNGPSNFIDFTNDFNTALFFALPKPCKRNFNNNYDDLNNYFSIYAYSDDLETFGDLSLKHIYGCDSKRRSLSDCITDFDFTPYEYFKGARYCFNDKNLWGSLITIVRLK